MEPGAGTPVTRALYGAPIRELLATRGDLTEMRTMLERAKTEISRLEDLKAAVSDLEKSITATEATRGVTGSGAAGIKVTSGLYMVDLRSLGLTMERQLAVEKAIQSVVLSAIADILPAGATTRGFDSKDGPIRPLVMGFVDLHEIDGRIP